MKNLIIIIILLSPSIITSQSADKNKGCLPLTIQFTSHEQTSYFWDFGDGSTSTLRSPQHIYTDAGMYAVTLYSDSDRNTTIGTLQIEVFPDLIVDIESNKTVGCVPESIQFTYNLDKHDDISILDFLWAFGDGNSSEQRNPYHTYQEEGQFDVSLQLTTNYTECNKTIKKDDLISLEKPLVDFSVDKTFSCLIPETFYIDNNSTYNSQYKYEWDFGNGITSDRYTPNPISYHTEGDYTISLTITSPNGCSATQEQKISLGKPYVDFAVEDTTCIGSMLQVINDSSSSSHYWEFGEGAEPKTSRRKSPEFTYNTAGIKTVHYRSSSGSCSLDTTFQILVSDKLSSFSVETVSKCSNPAILKLHAHYTGLDKYYWNNSRVEEGDVFIYEFDLKDRDEYHIHNTEMINLTLAVVTESGCIDSTEIEYKYQLPESFLVPSTIIGRAPLKVDFEDKGSSSDSIVQSIWKFGNGVEVTLGGDEKEVSHTYKKPGLYNVTLTVEDSSGCQNTSSPTTIEVINITDSELDDIARECEGMCVDCGEDGNRRTFCVGQDMMIFLPRTSYDLHLNMENDVLSHCWKENPFVDAPRFPGSFGATLDVEYKGFLLEKYEIPGTLKVDGPRADIKYEKKCSAPYEVHFTSESRNYQSLEWVHQDQVISRSQEFTYSFREKGIHEVILRAHSTTSECKTHTDTVEIHITTPEAVIKAPKELCDNVSYSLDASLSTDIYQGCGNNILWEFEHQRSRAVSDEVIDHKFPAGKQKLKLTITDINGCTAQAETQINVYGRQLNFNLDDRICFPHNTQLINTSKLDTTATEWAWSFGANEKSPNHTFTAADLHPIKKDTIEISVNVLDALGCRDTLTKYISVYQPESSISLSAQTACVGSQVNIKGIEFDDEGSYLNFEWDFGNGEQSNERNNFVEYSERGIYTISMIFAEAGSGCGDTLTRELRIVDQPIAEFSSSVDGWDVICHPHTISFTDESYVDGSVNYDWSFGQGNSSVLENPTMTLEKGITTVGLTVKSVHGCSSYTERNFELVGPSGDLFVSDKTLCFGEELLLELKNPDDVNEYNWDLGNGTVITDQNPVTYSYPEIPENNISDIDLVIKSTANGCESILSSTVRFQDITTDFSTNVDSLEFICHPHELIFSNQTESIGSTTFNWNFGNGQISQSKNPVHTFEKGTYDIELIGRTSFGCSDTSSMAIDVVGPSGLLNISDRSICLGDTITIDISDKDDVDYSQWTMSHGYEAENIESLTYSWQELPENNYSILNILLRSDDNGCETKLSKIIRIQDAIADFGINLDSNEVACFPFDASFENHSMIVGQEFFDWDFGDNRTSQARNPDHTYDKGEYTISLIASSSFGCKDTANISLSVNGPNAIVHVVKDSICYNEEAEIKLTDVSDTDAITWHLNNGEVISDNNLFHIIDHVEGDHIVTAELREESTGCLTTFDIPLFITKVIADFEQVEYSDFCFGRVELENLSYGSDSYIWHADEDYYTEDRDLIHYYQEIGGKEIQLVAIDQGTGCRDTLIKTIEIPNGTEYIHYPNVFSPNQDGKNDIFKPVIDEGYEDLVSIKEFSIYNRWGKQVYSYNQEEGWDGIADGQIQPSDVYAYYLELDIEGCQVIRQKGNVTIVR